MKRNRPWAAVSALGRKESAESNGISLGPQQTARKGPRRAHAKYLQPPPPPPPPPPKPPPSPPPPPWFWPRSASDSRAPSHPVTPSHAPSRPVTLAVRMSTATGKATLRRRRGITPPPAGDHSAAGWGSLRRRRGITPPPAGDHSAAGGGSLRRRRGINNSRPGSRVAGAEKRKSSCEPGGLAPPRERERERESAAPGAAHLGPPRGSAPRPQTRVLHGVYTRYTRVTHGYNDTIC